MRLAFLLVLPLLAACESIDFQGFGRAGNDGEVLVDSLPQGAFLSFSDGTICQTPCNVVVTEPVDVTIAAAGHAPVEAVIDETTPGTVTFELTPVGRTEQAEDVEVPL